MVYETLRTSFVKKRHALTQFEAYILGPGVTYVDDAPYRDDALRLALDSSLRRHRPLSMVDCMMRLILGERGFAIDALLTFNIGDFHDVCRDRGIEIV